MDLKFDMRLNQGMKTYADCFGLRYAHGKNQLNFCQWNQKANGLGTWHEG